MPEKSLIDPELVHPQQRIEEAVTFILSAHEHYALPLFESVPTYRQLASYLFDGLRRNQPAYRYVCVSGWRLALILVLVRMLGDDPAELYAIADAYDAYAPPEPARRWMAKVDSLYQASPADFRLD